MKIRRNSSEFSAGSSQDRNRKQRFRNRHFPGQLVKGVVLTEPKGGLSWVQISGQKLLAKLETRPRLGEEIYFRILHLHPEIHLKELNLSYQHEELKRSILSFWSLRSEFETLLRPHLKTNPPPSDPLSRREWLYHVLMEDPSFLPVYTNLLEAVFTINRFLSDMGQGRLVYFPWLFPRATGCELLFTAPQNVDVRKRQAGKYGISLLCRMNNAPFKVYISLGNSTLATYLQSSDGRIREEAAKVLQGLDTKSLDVFLDRVEVFPLAKDSALSILADFVADDLHSGGGIDTLV